MVLDDLLQLWQGLTLFLVEEQFGLKDGMLHLNSFHPHICLLSLLNFLEKQKSHFIQLNPQNRRLR
jgi:hypothetical protein